MKPYFAVLVAVLWVGRAGCSTPLERDAYNAAVAAKGFLDKERSAHPECASPQTSSTVCTVIEKGVAVKDSLIDAIGIYCAGPDFAASGKCDPPAKGTAAATQATAKLQAALDQWKQVSADIKAAAGEK